MSTVDRTAVCETCNGLAERVVLEVRNERRTVAQWRHADGSTDHPVATALGTVRTVR